MATNLDIGYAAYQYEYLNPGAYYDPSVATGGDKTGLNYESWKAGRLQRDGLPAAQVALLTSDTYTPSVNDALVKYSPYGSVSYDSTTGRYVDGGGNGLLYDPSSAAFLSVSASSQWTSTQVQNAITAASISSVSPGDAATLFSSHPEAFGAGVLGALSSAQVQALNVYNVSSLSSSNFAIIASQLSNSQLSQIFSINPNIINNVASSAFSSAQLQTFTPSEFQQLQGGIGGIAPSQFGQLTTGQLQGLQTYTGYVTPSQVSALSAAQFTALFSAYAPNVTQVQAVSAAVLNTFNAGQITYFRGGLANLTTAQLSGVTSTFLDAAAAGNQTSSFSAAQIAAISAAAVAGTSQFLGALSSAQAQALTTAQLQALSGAQVAAIQSRLSAPQLSALGAAQVGSLTTAQLQALPSASVQAFSSLAIAGFSTTQISTLIGTGNLSPQQVSQILPGTFSQIAPSVLNQLRNPQIAALTNAQLGALTASQLDGLSQTFTAALSASQLRAISGTSLQNDPTFVDSLTASEVQNLTTSQLQSLTDAQVSQILPNLTPSQVGQLSTSQTANLTAAEIASFSNPQVAGLSIGALSSSQVGAITASQIPALANSQIASLSLSQFGALAPDRIAALTPSQFASLPILLLQSLADNRLAAVTPAQLSALSQTQLDALSDSEIGALSGTQIGGLGQNIALLTGEQLANVSSAAVTSITSPEIAALGTNVSSLNDAALSGVTSSQAAAFSYAQIASLGKKIADITGAAFANIGVANIGALTNDELASLTSDEIAATTAAQAAQLAGPQVTALALGIRSLSPSVFASLSIAQVQALASNQVSSLTVSQLQALTASQIQALSPTQIAALTNSQLQVFSTNQIAAIAPYQLEYFAPSQIAALTSQQFGALDAAQLSALPAFQLQAVTGAQLSAVDPTALNAQADNFFNWLSQSAVQSLTSTQLAGLGAQHFQNAVLVSNFSDAQISLLNIAQVQALAPYAITRLLSPSAIAAINPQALAALSNDQLNALAPNQLQALTSDQWNALSAAQTQLLQARYGPVIDGIQTFVRQDSSGILDSVASWGSPGNAIDFRSALPWEQYLQATLDAASYSNFYGREAATIRQAYGINASQNWTQPTPAPFSAGPTVNGATTQWQPDGRLAKDDGTGLFDGLSAADSYKLQLQLAPYSALYRSNIGTILAASPYAVYSAPLATNAPDIATLLQQAGAYFNPNASADPSGSGALPESVGNPGPVLFGIQTYYGAGSAVGTLVQADGTSFLRSNADANGLITSGFDRGLNVNDPRVSADYALGYRIQQAYRENPQSLQSYVATATGTVPQGLYAIPSATDIVSLVKAAGGFFDPTATTPVDAPSNVGAPSAVLFGVQTYYGTGSAAGILVNAFGQSFLQSNADGNGSVVSGFGVGLNINGDAYANAYSLGQQIQHAYQGNPNALIAYQSDASAPRGRATGSRNLGDPAITPSQVLDANFEQFGSTSTEPGADSDLLGLLTKAALNESHGANAYSGAVVYQQLQEYLAGGFVSDSFVQTVKNAIALEANDPAISSGAEGANPYSNALQQFINNVNSGQFSASGAVAQSGAVLGQISGILTWINGDSVTTSIDVPKDVIAAAHYSYTNLPTGLVWITNADQNGNAVYYAPVAANEQLYVGADGVFYDLKHLGSISQSDVPTSEVDINKFLASYITPSQIASKALIATATLDPSLPAPAFSPESFTIAAINDAAALQGDPSLGIAVALEMKSCRDSGLLSDSFWQIAQNAIAFEASNWGDARSGVPGNNPYANQLATLVANANSPLVSAGNIAAAPGSALAQVDNILNWALAGDSKAQIAVPRVSAAGVSAPGGGDSHVTQPIDWGDQLAQAVQDAAELEFFSAAANATDKGLPQGSAEWWADVNSQLTGQPSNTNLPGTEVFADIARENFSGGQSSTVSQSGQNSHGWRVGVNGTDGTATDITNAFPDPIGRIALVVPADGSPAFYVYNAPDGADLPSHAAAGQSLITTDNLNNWQPDSSGNWTWQQGSTICRVGNAVYICSQFYGGAISDATAPGTDNYPGGHPDVSIQTGPSSQGLTFDPTATIVSIRDGDYFYTINVSGYNMTFTDKQTGETVLFLSGYAIKTDRNGHIVGVPISVTLGRH